MLTKRVNTSRRLETAICLVGLRLETLLGIMLGMIPRAFVVEYQCTVPVTDWTYQDN
jgi:hypothetical protein